MNVIDNTNATDCWTSKVNTFLASLGATPPEGLHTHHIRITLPFQLPVRSILGNFAKRISARWVCPDTLGDARDLPNGATGLKACRCHECMGVTPSEGALSGWPAHVETALPQTLHRVRMRFRMGYWELEVNRPKGHESAWRTCRLCA